MISKEVSNTGIVGNGQELFDLSMEGKTNVVGEGENNGGGATMFKEAAVAATAAFNVSVVIDVIDRL